MDDLRRVKLTDYIIYLTKSHQTNNTIGRYLKAVTLFLENADSINIRGYRKFKKEFMSDMLVGRDPDIAESAILDFLSFNGVGYHRRKERHIKSLEKIPVISSKNVAKVNEFMVYLQDQRDYSHHTLRIYKDGLTDFFRYSTDFSMEKAKGYIKTQENLGRAPQTISLRITALEKYSEFIHKPIKLNRPKYKKSLNLENIPDKKEYDRLISYLSGFPNRDYYYWIKILATTGARLSEFLEMKWEDVAAGELVLKGKGNKYRRFFFPKELQMEARKYIKETGKTGIIATGKFGRISDRGLNERLKSWGEKCGIPKEKMHPHAFRHFFAKMFLSKTNDIVKLADIMGHGSIDTTRIYLQRSYAEQKRDYDGAVTW